MSIPVVIELSTIGESPAAALGLCVNMMEKMVKAAIDLAEKGDLVSDRMRAFKGNIEALQRATSGEVSQIELVNTALGVQNMNLGLSSQGMETLFRFAKRASDQGLGPLEGVVNGVARAMATGRTRSLIPYGLDLQKIEQASDKVAEITRQLEGRIEQMGEGMNTAGDAVARAKAKWDDYTNSLAQSFSESERLSTAIDGLVAALDGVPASSDDAGMALADMAATGIEWLTKLYRKARQVAGVLRLIDRHGEDGWSEEGIDARLARVASGEAGNETAEERSQAHLNMIEDPGERAEAQRLHNVRFGVAERRAAEEQAENLASGEAEPDRSFIAPLTAEERTEYERQRREARRRGGGRNRQESNDVMSRSIMGLGTPREFADADFGGGEDEFGEAVRRPSTWGSPGDMDRQQNEARAALLKSEKDHYLQRLAQQRDYNEKARQLDEMRLSAISGYVDTFGGIAQQAAEQFGASEGAIVWIEAIKTAALAAVEIGQSLIPGIGAAHIPAAIGLTAAATFAFARAADLGHGGKSEVPKLSGGKGGDAGPRGSSGNFSGGGGGGGGGGGNIITINMGQSLSTSRDVGRAVRQALIHAADGGEPLPYRAVGRR